MKPRHVRAALLSLWILVGGIPALADGGETAPNGSSAPAGDAGKPEMSRSISAPERESLEGRRSKVIVYYFHRKVRCDECLAVEKLSKGIVAKEFPELLTTGRLEFRAVLLDDKDNWHYVDEFLLTGPSLVIADTRDNGVVRWKKLEKVWDLIGAASEFRSYVVEAIEEYSR